MRPKINRNLVDLESPWTARFMGDGTRSLGIVDEHGEPSKACEHIHLFNPTTGEVVYSCRSFAEHIDEHGSRVDVLAFKGRPARTRHLVTKDRALKIDEPFRIGSELFLPVKYFRTEVVTEEPKVNDLDFRKELHLRIDIHHARLRYYLDPEDIDETTGNPRLCAMAELAEELHVIKWTEHVETAFGTRARMLAESFNALAPVYLHIDAEQAGLLIRNRFELAPHL